METIGLIGIITGFTGLIVAILTHVKHSDCCKGLLEFDTREPAQINYPLEPAQINYPLEPAQINCPPPTPVASRSTAV
jgi:hypothetical protein